MTEQEWLACNDPHKILTFLQGTVSNRKLRLFSVACCRQVWKHLTDARARAAVRVAEQYADRKVTRKRLTEVRKAARQAVLDQQGSYWRQRAFHAALDCVEADFPSMVYAGQNAYGAVLCHPRSNVEKSQSIQQNQCSLLRCITGNPFHSATIAPTWLTSTVIFIAHAIYEKRAFDRMPILADALEETGCDQPDILAHCRQPGDHVRGCWIVDLILGKQ